MGKVYGYIRILSEMQDVENQIILMREMEVPERNIFIDRQGTGQYRRLLEKLKGGDLLYVRSLCDLGDGYREVGEQWRSLTKGKRTDVVVLDTPQLDTRRGKTQCGPLVEDVVFSMLEFAADAEWLARKEKQREGIEKAKDRGVKFGRPELPWGDNFSAVYQMWKRKEIRGDEAAELCHISRTLFYKRAGLMRKVEEKKVCADEGGGEIR